MNKNIKTRLLSMLRNSALTCVVAATAACGGGSGGTAEPAAAAAPAPAQTTLSGVVAVGAPLAGANVVLVDADPTTPDPGPIVAGADGSYSMVVTGLKAPFMIRATGTANGVSTTLSALVPGISDGSANLANVTSLTDAIATLVAPGGDVAALNVPSALSAAATSQKVSDASALLVNTLKSDPQIAAALGANFSPLSTSFAADGTGIDAVLALLDVRSSAGAVSILNRAAAVSDTSLPTPVTLSAAQTATPAVAPTMPLSATAGSVPTPAELALLGKKIEACLALPIAQRFTADAAGNATAVSEACNFVAADFKSNGRTWLQDIGESGLMTTPATVGAKLAGSSVALSLAPLNDTDPKVFKHPYCNTANCTVARYNWSSPSNYMFSNLWVLNKINGALAFVGNQRPYDVFVTSRHMRYTEMNSAGAAANPTVYGFRNRVESQMRLIFNPSWGKNPANIRAVRWTGPGLPAAGVVTFRSQSCGTDDRFAITYQTGSTRVIGTTSAQYWTGGTGVDFKLSAANHDGSILALPTPNNATAANQDNAPVPLTETIPAWSVYSAELFYFSSAASSPDTPDEIVKVRISSPIEPASFIASRAWPSLAQNAQDSYIKPTGANAGAISSLASSLSWTAPVGVAVTSAYLFGQNSATVTNSEGESASQRLRTRLDLRPASFGDTSATGWQFATVGAGTALSTFTSTQGTNPNPRCTSTDVVPLTTGASDYREVGLSFSDDALRNYTGSWYWNN